MALAGADLRTTGSLPNSCSFHFSNLPLMRYQADLTCEQSMILEISKSPAVKVSLLVATRESLPLVNLANSKPRSTSNTRQSHPFQTPTFIYLEAAIILQVLSGRKLLTCRYWAFGPGCPNIDHNGIDVCPYAHCDTGRLSNFYEQRGTCWWWATNRGCWWGPSCTFEHRDTGYMGVHDGSK